MGRAAFTVFCAVVVWISPIQAATPYLHVSDEIVPCSRFSGVFVGIGDYAHLPYRPQAAASAEALSALFASVPISTANTLLLDGQATHAAVTKALRELRAADRGDCAIFYFAGRVFTLDTDLDEQIGILLMAESRDAHSSAEASLSMRYLRQLFESNSIGGVFLLIDAAIGGLQGDALHAEADSLSQQSRLVLTAGGRGEETSSSGDVSPFAEALMTGLSHLSENTQGAVAGGVHRGA